MALDGPRAGPDLPPAVPRRGSAVTRAVGRLVLRLLRSRVEGAFPDTGRAVLIAAPHTSNWDFVLALAAILALGVRVDWIGKHTIFRGPWGRIWRALGGIPVDRAAPDGAVEAATGRLATGDVYLALAPEGSRRRVARWKTGFHRIARAVGVPVVPVALDWGARRVRILPAFTPTADAEADIGALRALFRREMCRHPAGFWE